MFFEELSATAGTLHSTEVTSFGVVGGGGRQRRTHTADDGDDPVLVVDEPKKPKLFFAKSPLVEMSPPPSTLSPPKAPPIPPPPPPPNVSPLIPAVVEEKNTEDAEEEEEEGSDVETSVDETKIDSSSTTSTAPPFARSFKQFLQSFPVTIEQPSEMKIVPYILCPKPCQNQGWCNYQTGACNCPSGYTGNDCGTADEFPCNHPDGVPVTTRCAGTCDMNLNRCQCGPDTPFPKREIGGWCQPDLAAAKGLPRDTWQNPMEHTGNKQPLPWHWVFGVEAAREQPEIGNTVDQIDDEVTRGDTLPWCFANMTATLTPVDRRPAQVCAMDCPAGVGNAPNCDAPLPGTFCPNQCSGSGECVGGFCSCELGHWGADCSLSSATRSDDEDTSKTIPKKKKATTESSAVTVRRRASPLIYIYEVDSEFTSGQHQKRKSEGNCVPREYQGYKDGSIPLEPKETSTSWYYSLEITFYEFLSRSAHRTLDPGEADLFYSPFATACFQLRYNRPSPSHWAGALKVPARSFGVYSQWNALYQREIAKRIREPLISKARAKRGYHVKQLSDDELNNLVDPSKLSPATQFDDLSDHVFITPYDEGACYLPPALRTGIFLTHFGNTGSKHARSATAYTPDRWGMLTRPNTIDNETIPDLLNGWRCYDPAKDLVVPPWNRRRYKEDDKSDPKLWSYGRKETLFFFAGDLGTAEGIKESGPHASEDYSLGIRQRVTKHLRDRESEGFLISGHMHVGYDEAIGKSTFCGTFPGDGWSGGILTYLKYGCIPVIINDGVDMPFQRIGAWRSEEGSLGQGWEKDFWQTKPEDANDEAMSAKIPSAETLLEYARFSIRVAEADIESLDVLLGKFTDAEIRSLQNEVARVRQLFSYDVPDQPFGVGPTRPVRYHNQNSTAATLNQTGFLADADRVLGGGAADLAQPGVGVGTFPNPPWDAFEMIMASLRYKLELRKERRDVD